MKYLIALLFCSSAYAICPCGDKDCNYDAYDKVFYAEGVWTSVDPVASLEKMATLIKLAQNEPSLMAIIVMEMQRELNQCKIWLALQHSN